jgi:GGDEF domain-containing protein
MVERAPETSGLADARLETTIVDLLEENSDGFIVLGHDGEVLFVNASAASMFGEVPSDLMGGALEIEINSGDHEGTAELRIRQVSWQGTPASLIHLRDVTWERDDATRAFRATHDEVTGLPNRYLLDDRIAQTISRAERGERGIFLFYCVVQGPEGQCWPEDQNLRDQVLRETAKLLTRVVRPSDTIAHLGDGEFAVLCDQLDAGRAKRIETRLRASFAGTRPPEDAHLTAELRVGSVAVDDSLLDADMLLEWAKKAMDPPQ